AGGYRWVLLAQRTGRRVARIDVFLPTGGRRSRLESLEFVVGHVDLAADFYDLRPAGALQLVRNVGNRLQVGRDVLAHGAVAARGALNEHAILVAKRRRQAVDLGLGGEGKFQSLVALEEAAAALDEIDDVLIGIGLRKTEHRRGVPHLCKAFGRGRPDGAGWAVRADQVGKGSLDLGIAPTERVIFSIGDLRRILLMVGDVGCGDLARQPLQFGGGLFGCQLVYGNGSCGHARPLDVARPYWVSQQG